MPHPRRLAVTLATALLALPAVLLAPGCGATPKTAEDRAAKIEQAERTLETMKAKDASLSGVLDDAYGWAVFSTVGRGALIVGGEGGGGIVFEQGAPWGSATLAKGSIGLQIGGEAYSELVIFMTEQAFRSFTAGDFSFTAGLSATGIKAGAALETPIESGMKVLVMTKGGLMASAAVGGQDFSCTPFGSAE